MTTNTTTQKLLEDLKSPERNVRMDAARNPNASPEVLLIAMKDEYQYVRQVAAANSNATPQVLLIALKDNDYFVRRAAKWAIEENPLLQLQIAALQGKASS